MGLYVATMAAWFALVVHGTAVPLPALIVLGGVVICLQGSLQHEFLHGHPTRWQRLNNLLAYPPLALWIPYRIYHDSHHEHHRSPRLTDPELDPESFHVSADTWQNAGVVNRAVLRINGTLAGRMLLGPWLVVGRFWMNEIIALSRGVSPYLFTWLGHLASVTVLLSFIHWCGLPVWVYVIAFVWPGIALTLQRSFAEHRPGDSQDDSTAMVDAHPFWSLLYLNNNLHRVHHSNPSMPWYALPKELRRDTKRYLPNGSYRFKGYSSIWRQWGLNARSLIHPGR